MANNGVWVQFTPEQEAAEKALMSKAEAGLKAIVKNLNKQLVVQANPDFGYVSGFSYKWSRDSLYLEQTVKYDSKDALAKEKVFKLGRIDFYVDNSCGLSYMRHTGKWHLICSGETIEYCLDLVENDPIFHG
jgi:hypothetical protein